MKRSKRRVTTNGKAPESEEPLTDRRVWTARELIEEDHTFSWLAKGLLPEGSQSVTGGEKKSLKSYVDTFINVGVAAGVDIFGRFSVPESRPVRVYVGEGGSGPYARRLERVARSMGVDLDSIPLHVQFETAPILTERFRTWQVDDLGRFSPGRVSLDPLYPFHGDVSAGNLYERGALLNAYSEPYALNGVAANIVDHFNKTGTGRGLDRLAQAGMAEWADSWILLTHRETADVESGRFRLLMEAGSRQWGGREWDLDLNLGRFNEDLCDHEGDITWELRPHVPKEQSRTSHGKAERRIRDVLDEHGFEHTKTEIRDKVGGNRDAFDAAWNQLENDGLIEERPMSRREGSRSRSRSLWGIAT